MPSPIFVSISFLVSAMNNVAWRCEMNYVRSKDAQIRQKARTSFMNLFSLYGRLQ